MTLCGSFRTITAAGSAPLVGELESVHIGRSRRVPVVAVENYVESLRSSRS